MTVRDPRQQRLPFAEPGAERRAVRARPARKALVIEAGAGTGKTTSIVRELLGILIDEPELVADRVVLITFTEKAAGEIAERIREAISSLHQTRDRDLPSWPEIDPIFEAASDDPERSLRAIENHFRQVDRFQSQTIHAFCQRILRLYPIEAGLHPQFVVVEGFERNRIYDAIYAQWLRRETGSEATKETMEQWETALAHYHRLDSIQSLILSLLPKRDLIQDETYSLGDISEAEPDILRVLDDIRSAEAGAVAEVSDEWVLKVLSHVRANRPPAGGTVEEWIDYFEPVSDALARVHVNKTKGFRTHFKFLRGEKPSVTIFERLRNHRAAVAVRALASRFASTLDREKRERGIVDFDDLLFATRTLLENEEILSDLRARFDYLFVDEFQDTDRVQAEIVDKLARDANGSIVPGRTILVGDPKQSIYSFRRADPETYQETVRRFVEEGAEERVLVDQYRSDPPLVSDLNRMFEQLFSVPSTTSVARPSYEPLTARRSVPVGDMETRVTFLQAKQQEGSDLDEREAEAIAGWILGQVNRERPDWRRFAILLRKLTNVDRYVEVFELFGIPCFLPPTRSFLDRRAVVDAMAVLRAIAYPFDDSAMISAARSPYFALHDDAIVARYLQKDREHPEYELFVRRIEGYARLSRQIPIGDLIERLLEDTGIRLVYGATSDGERSIRYLEALRDLAVEFDGNAGGSLARFVDEIGRRKTEDVEPEPSVLDEDRNAVTIMSVHASKGLEFDTVILPDLSSRMKSESVRLFSIEEPKSLIFTGRLSSLAGEFRQSEDLPLREIGKQRLEAELDRLFYVAVTRARSDVVFVCDPGEKTSEFWKCLERIFCADPKRIAEHFPLDSSSVIRPMAVCFGQMNVRLQRANEIELDPAESSRLATPQVESLVRSGINAIGNEEPPVIETLTPAELARRRAASRNRTGGILLHRVLELWDGESNSLEALTRALAGEVRAEGSTVERVLLRARTVAGSSHGKWLLNAEVVGKEMPIFYLDDRGTVAEGRIDLLLREGDGFLVVDYKSGSRTAERLQDDGEQVRRYCAAMTAMTGRACRGALWYIDADREELVEVSGPDSSLSPP